MVETNTQARDLDGKVAIITGSARNMGRAFADALSARGADVTVHHHGDSSKMDAEETAAAVRGNGRRALVIAGDLSETDTVRRLFRETKEAFGRIDIVINNAGIVLKKPIAEVSEEEFDRVFGINAKAPFFVMQEAARTIEDGGRIINMGTSLLAATTGGYGAYTGSKAPLEDLTRALAKEIGDRGVTVNTVAPGPIDTAFFHGEENEESTEFLKHMSVGNRLGRIDDVVPVIDFLTSEEARWVTAQTLFVNGGFTAR